MGGGGERGVEEQKASFFVALFCGACSVLCRLFIRSALRGIVKPRVLLKLNRHTPRRGLEFRDPKKYKESSYPVDLVFFQRRVF